jgi:hypothetical protein
MAKCDCVIRNRKEDETQREWLKRVMCMNHWMQTDYYQRKLPEEKRSFPVVPESEPRLVKKKDEEKEDAD